MGIKYNRALDLVAFAMDEFRNGRITSASQKFAEAAMHQSADAAMTVIATSNRKAIQASKAQAEIAAKKAKAKKPNPFAKKKKAKAEAEDLDLPGEELRVEVDESQGMREVQEADLEDLEETAADEDDSDEETAADDDSDDSDEDKDDEKAAVARFRRALHNMGSK